MANLPFLPTLDDVLDAAKNVGQATNALDPKNIINPKTKHESTVRDLVDWAGWNGKDIDIMTAVALAEGGALIDGDGNIKCERNFAGCCVGLFQINIDAHKISQEDACDYAKAAKFSYGLWKTEQYEPWEAYTNGSYKKFMGQNKKITLEKGVFGGGTDQEGPGGVNLPDLSPGAAIKALTELIAKIFDPSTWLRFGKIIFGVLIFLVGIIGLLYLVLKPLLGVAAKNSPGGKAFLFQRTKASNV